MTAPSAAYLAARAQAAAQFCDCWRVVRRDAAVFGFTDHDRALSFDGLTFEPSAALSPSEAAAGLDLSVGDVEAAGALSSLSITAADLAAGLWDGAAVTRYEVAWADPALPRAVLAVYELGGVQRGELGFTAQLISRAARLGDKRGRLMTASCDATLGDARCGVDLSASAFRGVGLVTSAQGRRLEASGLSGFAPGLFARGVLTWTGGPNAGGRADVKSHGAGGALELWRTPPAAIAAGHAFTVTAGCDKALATCRDRFGNVANFRGFPHMPREDAAATYATRGDRDMDGGSRFA